MFNLYNISSPNLSYSASAVHKTRLNFLVHPHSSKTSFVYSVY